VSVVEIFNGTTTPGTPSAWVEVPESALYSVQTVGGGTVECSVDGVNAFTVNTATFGPVNSSGSELRKLTVPVKYMRLAAVGSALPMRVTALAL